MANEQEEGKLVVWIVVDSLCATCCEVFSCLVLSYLTSQTLVSTLHQGPPNNFIRKASTMWKNPSNAEISSKKRSSYGQESWFASFSPSTASANSRCSWASAGSSRSASLSSLAAFLAAFSGLLRTSYSACIMRSVSTGSGDCGLALACKH